MIVTKIVHYVEELSASPHFLALMMFVYSIELICTRRDSLFVFQFAHARCYWVKEYI